MVEFNNGFSFEILDCRGSDLPYAFDSWDVACPPPHVELLSGVPPAADRYAPQLAGFTVADDINMKTTPCLCDPALMHINCNAGPDA